ncbi:immunoglobulin-like domain-containing protein [Aquimarina gracilis]|uniref:Immunoglobulin-like domain-containing protein n=1 Tax=Aquimarina gracilis TaxID=874422 RepID=A0ABU5ZY79_9FLAO|nr:immunoglobulin-like domain-containing protein [Aquimarina gracilis]MEB3346844.1 immunoglobulin-like domain-containing protein [Aquimarina gracilis]
MKKLLLLLLASFCFAYNAQAQCGSGEDTTPPVFGNAGDGTMANPFRNLLQTTVGSVPSGTYYFNFNGNTFQGELDNDTDGGGWLMILNYVHVAGDNSALTVRNTDLPLLGSSTLGDNEGGTTNWGHMGNALAAAIDFEEMRFYGATTGHNRVIDFKTNYTNALNYVKTGTGSFNGINIASNFTTLAGHTANIPALAFNTFSNQGDLALTNFPFWRSGQFHWGIGASGRWEVDDFAVNTESTIHRVWVRGDLSPAATTTLNLNLDATGNLTIAPSDFGLTATDNCATTPSLSLSQTDFDCTNIGNNIVQLTATDDQNNSTVIDVTVVIVESAPVITSDNFATINLDATGNASITLADLNASATDDCGLQSFTLDQTDFDCTNASRTVTVTLTATDFNGNTSTREVSVAVQDPIDPVVQCVTPFTLELDATGNATITENDIVLSATDNCTVRGISLSKSSFTCADIGDNVVTVFVRDNDGNQVSCSTTVTVTIPSCPSDFTLESDPTTCGAIYNYPCASNITSGPPSGTLLAVGSTTTFTYDTLDNTGGTVSCSYDVTVVDTRAPLFNTQDHIITLNANETATISASDIIGFDPLARDYTLDTSGTFDRTDISTTGTKVTLDDDDVSNALPIGFEFGFYGNLYTEFYISSNGFITFSDEGDDGCCDGQNLPNTSTPNNLIAYDWTDINPEEGGTIRYTTIGTAPNRIAIIDFDAVHYYDTTPDATTTQIKLFEGTNRIEIHGTSTFDAGNDKTQGIENIDGTAAIVVPGRNESVWATTNDYVAFVPTSGTFDNCGIDTMEVSPNTFDCSNKGDNMVTLTITDVNGNSTSKTAIVRIETADATAPVITLTGADPQIIEFGDGYTELGATTDDGSTVVIDTSDFVDTVGSYSIRYNATDDSCNTAEVTRTVNVVDTTAPVITLLGDNPQTIELGDGYTELGATTDDGTNVTINGSNFVDAVGTYFITYTATDASGNMAIELTRTVNVVDTTAPVITLLGDNPQIINQGSGYTELGATTNDESEIIIDASQFVDAEGTYTITYNATDTSGNRATQITRTVIVVSCAIDNLPANNFEILASSETCPDKNNGVISINTLETENYIATINNQTYPFASTLEVTDLAPGRYPVCIIIDGEPNCELCFEMMIEEGEAMTGKTSVTTNRDFNKEVQVEIETGTPPFIVTINNSVIGEYNTKSFMVAAKNGDLIEVTSHLACEGKLSTKIEGVLSNNISLYPNPTRSNVSLALPQTAIEKLTVTIYNTLGAVVHSKTYSKVGNQVALPMEDLPAGAYFVRVNEVAKTFKVIKK